MSTVSAFRVEVLRAPTDGELGVRLLLEAPEFRAPQYVVRVERVRLLLAAGVRAGQTAKGEPRLYQEFNPYGQTAQAAVALGWCRVLEGEQDRESVLESVGN